MMCCGNKRTTDFDATGNYVPVIRIIVYPELENDVPSSIPFA